LPATGWNAGTDPLFPAYQALLVLLARFLRALPSHAYAETIPQDGLRVALRHINDGVHEGDRRIQSQQSAVDGRYLCDSGS
jgi:hypothetical protein